MKELANECKRAGGTPKHQIKDFDNMKAVDLRKKLVVWEWLNG